MDRAALDTAIDTVFDDTIADYSLDPSEEGAVLKTLADYTDQEVRTKIVKKTITHAQLLALMTTPIELIPAVAGKAYLPMHFLLKYVDNLGWGNSGSPWIIKLAGQSISNFSTQIGSSSVTEQTVAALAGNLSTTGSFFNEALIITATSNPSTPADPNTTAVVYVTYAEIIL
ncbi:MAG: hypothetical protein H7Y10_03690 [Flavobacterium sp.]|nr:hypothetical protein [Flavobacterium sp.]